MKHDCWEGVTLRKCLNIFVNKLTLPCGIQISQVDQNTTIHSLPDDDIDLEKCGYVQQQNNQSGSRWMFDPKNMEHLKRVKERIIANMSKSVFYLTSSILSQYVDDYDSQLALIDVCPQMEAEQSGLAI